MTVDHDADPEAVIDQLAADLDAAQEATDAADRELTARALRLDIQDAIARLDDPATRGDTLEELLAAEQYWPTPTVWATEDDGRIELHAWGWDPTSLDGTIEIGPIHWTGDR